jgi:hypothetical protein
MLKDPYIYRSADKFIPHYEDFRHSDIDKALSIINGGGDDLPSATCQAFWYFLREPSPAPAVSHNSAESVLDNAEEILNDSYRVRMLKNIPSFESRLAELQSGSMHDQRLSLSAACVFVHLSGLTARLIGFASEGMSERVIEILERAIEVFNAAHQDEQTPLNKTESAFRVSALLAKSWMHAVLFDHNAHSIRNREALEQLALAVDACLKAGRASTDTESDQLSNRLPGDEVTETNASTIWAELPAAAQEGTINLQESIDPEVAFQCFELLYRTGKGVEWNSVAHDCRLIRDAYYMAQPIHLISTDLLSLDLAFDGGEQGFGVEPREAWGQALQIAEARGAGGPAADQIEEKEATDLRVGKARLTRYFFNPEAAISDTAWEVLIEADRLYTGMNSAGPVMNRLNSAIRLLLKGNIKTPYEEWFSLQYQALPSSQRPLKTFESLKTKAASRERSWRSVDDIGLFLDWTTSKEKADFDEFLRTRRSDSRGLFNTLRESLVKFNHTNNGERHGFQDVDLSGMYRLVMGIGRKGLVQTILDLGERLKA